MADIWKTDGIRRYDICGEPVSEPDLIWAKQRGRYGRTIYVHKSCLKEEAKKEGSGAK